MATKQGKYTLKLDNTPSIVSYASVVSKKEGEGPMAPYFDIINGDSSFGQQSWEKAEVQMQKDVVDHVLLKAGLAAGDIDCMFAGDLLNQCVSSSYGARDLGVPFFGVYGACSTMAESLALASMMVEGGLSQKAMAVTSSHFCSAERQYRFPLEYGGQRPPTAQWTVTGAGAVIVGEKGMSPYVRAVTIGTIEDKKIKDANNMGAAMAPAAQLTIKRFFEDTLTNADNYDMILTGDLGLVGSQLLLTLLEQDGYPLGKKHADCGLLIFDRDSQWVNAGGSGCGCSASVLCSYILNAMRDGKLNDVLFVATGALLSTTTVQQGESIPSIAHLVHLSTSAQ